MVVTVVDRCEMDFSFSFFFSSPAYSPSPPPFFLELFSPGWGVVDGFLPSTIQFLTFFYFFFFFPAGGKERGVEQ